MPTPYTIKKGKRKGQEVLLLNPWEKGTKYFNELVNDKKLTNTMNIKFNPKNGKPVRLSDTQRSYRQGYLDAQKDARKCYNSQQKKMLGNYNRQIYLPYSVN